MEQSQDKSCFFEQANWTRQGGGSVLYTATQCNTLQHTGPAATHCTTLQHAATHCITLQHIAQCSTLQRIEDVPCYVLQHAATHCNTLQHLQHTATHCNTLQHAATHCTMQHTATRYKTLQHNEEEGCYSLQHTATHCITLHTATHCNATRRQRTSCSREPFLGPKFCEKFSCCDYFNPDFLLA